MRHPVCLADGRGRFFKRAALLSAVAVLTLLSSALIAAPAGAHTSTTFNGYCDTPTTNGCDDYLTRDEGIFNGVVGWNNLHPGCNCSLVFEYVNRINDTAIRMNIKPRGANYIWHRCIVDHDRGAGYAGVNVSCEFGRY
jgi:hypothetical protein